MRVRLLIVLFCLMPCFGFTQRVSSIANQQWIHDFVQIKFSDKISAGFDCSVRWKDNFFYFNNYIARININYTFNERFKTATGVSAAGYYSAGNFKTFEYRFHQDLVTEWKRTNSTFSIRLRFEERFFKDRVWFDEYNSYFHLRTRISSGFQFKIFNLGKKKSSQLWFYLGEEFFFNADKFLTPEWFDQNRILAGPILKLNKSLSFQVNYNLQLLNSGVKNEFKLNNTVWFIVRHQLDWK